MAPGLRAASKTPGAILRSSVSGTISTVPSSTTCGRTGRPGRRRTSGRSRRGAEAEPAVDRCLGGDEDRDRHATGGGGREVGDDHSSEDPAPAVRRQDRDAADGVRDHQPAAGNGDPGVPRDVGADDVVPIEGGDAAGRRVGPAAVPLHVLVGGRRSEEDGGLRPAVGGEEGGFDVDGLEGHILGHRRDATDPRSSTTIGLSGPGVVSSTRSARWRVRSRAKCACSCWAQRSQCGA